MKTKPTVFLVLFLIITGFVGVQAQTITWTGNGDGINWSDLNNWDLLSVPGSSNDVIIPDGSSLTIDASATTQSIDVQGTVILNMDQNLSFTNASSFSSGTNVYWNSGSFNGGGTLTSNGTITLDLTGSKQILGGTTIDNNGTINLTNGADITITDGTLNNNASGLIDIQAHGSNLSLTAGGTHDLVNEGVIRKTGGGTSIISAVLINNNGTLDSQSGTLELSNAAIELNGGTFLVSAGAILELSATVNCSGTLSGNLVGNFEWSATVTVSGTATFDFSGVGINWYNGGLNGGGTLTNNGLIFLSSTGTKQITAGTTLSNNGTIDFFSGDLSIADGIINNNASGIIDIQADNSDILLSGAGSHDLNNTGLIKKSAGAGQSSITAELHNNGGTLEVQSGWIRLANSLITFTGGTYNTSSGAELRINNTVTVSGTMTGNGMGTINWDGIITVASTASFDVSGNGVNWRVGTLNGGGTLTVNDKLSLTTTALKQISSLTTVVNNDSIVLVNGADMYLNDGTVNNSVGGVIDLNGDRSDLLNNSGTTQFLDNQGKIVKTAETGEAYISVDLDNTGTIESLIGRIRFNNASITLTGGIFNTASTGEIYFGQTVSCSGVLTGNNQGELTWAGTISVPGTATFNFTGNPLNWTSGVLDGMGVLTTESPVELTTTGTKQVLDSTSWINNDSIILSDGSGAADLRISFGVFENSANGVIEMQGTGCDLNYSGGFSTRLLKNYGMIVKTGGAGSSNINVELMNIGGILESQAGILAVNSSLMPAISGGVLNTSTGAEIELRQTVFCSGTLSGTSNGVIEWIGDLSVPASAIFNFDGNGLDWYSGDLIGGGDLTNQGNLYLTGTALKRIIDSTTLLNADSLIFEVNADIYINDGVINNQSNGVIEIQGDYTQLNSNGGDLHVLHNDGILNKSGGDAISSIFTDSTTNNGIVSVVSGELEFNNDLDNRTDGIIKGTGILDLPLTADFNNDGIFSPGLSLGTLDLLGDYSMSTSARLEFELEGLAGGGNSGGHDSLYVDGTVEVAGTLDIIFTPFALNHGDEFVLIHSEDGLSGTFTKINVPDISPLKWQITYGPDDLVLTAVDCDLAGVTVTWVGGNGDWDNPANWDIGVPNWCDDVIIGTGVDVTIPGDYGSLCRSISIGNGSQLINSSGSNLYVDQ